MNLMQRSIVVVFCAAALLGGPQILSAQDITADAELVETRTEVPKLKAPAEYKMQDNTVLIEISEYAGYAGLIAANGGLEPGDNSLFAKKYGFKVKLAMSEADSWSPLNSGKLAACPSTVDVLAVYGRQLDAVVPVLIGFSRGADGLVVQKSIKRINDLAGKTLATSQFNEADFLIRYLAQEAGLSVNMLPNLQARPAADKVNLVYCADAFGAGDLFLRDLKAGRNRLAGCVTWAPKTTEVASGSNGKASILLTNRNLLIVADILMINKGFAKSNPKIVAGLVSGLLEGNHQVRTEPDKYADVIGKAFKWDAAQTRSELAKVHLANLPENQAFFSGKIDSAGSYNFIYETAGYVYGSELLGKQIPCERLLDLAQLAAAETSGLFKDQKASITPLRSAGGAAESTGESVLSKDIRFLFKPNSSKLETGSEANAKGLQSISQLIKVAPGSTVLLRGHADGSLLEKFRQEGGQARVMQAKLQLKNLSKARCEEVKLILQEKYGFDAARIEVQGVGADEPTGKGPDADRRVEVQWFTVE